MSMLKKAQKSVFGLQQKLPRFEGHHKIKLRILLSSLALLQLSADDLALREERLEVRHIEARGVGYHRGYTSLDGFFMIPHGEQARWFPFFDLRGHLFDDKKFAANAGVGLRYLRSRVWGASLFYDYRSTKHLHYNQIGIGLENLGKTWDFRMNGYLPVGKKKSPFYHTRFDKFSGHHMILSRKREFAMKGADAEAGVHLKKAEHYSLYAAAGPYYFEKSGKVALGGEGRVQLIAFDVLDLKMNASYDRVFRTVVQGEIGLRFSWGEPKKVKSKNPQDNTLHARILQTIDRHEIITLSHKRRKFTAINPATHAPYFFWFVDNTSHSAGTFESPFNTLSAAQNASQPNDIIYIFPGDGTDRGLNTGIILQQGQQLLGAGTAQQLQTTRQLINIPAQAKGVPRLTNALAPNRAIVTLQSSNNVLSGFNLVDTIGNPSPFVASGNVFIKTGSNYLIKNNTISAFNTANMMYILQADSTLIANNLFLGLDNNDTYGVYAHSVTNFTVINNQFTGINATSGIDLSFIYFPGNPTGQGSFTVINNVFSSEASLGAIDQPVAIYIGNFRNSALGNVKGNNINMPAGMLNAMAGVYVLEDSTATGPLAVTLHKNVSITIPPTLGYEFINANANPNFLIVDFGEDNIGTSDPPFSSTPVMFPSRP